MSDSISRDLTVPECNGNGKTDAVNPNVTEVIVIRHGETVWNADGRFQGQLDIELNDVGRQQAIAVAKRLSREPKISIVYSSDLKRAYVTAETIARICGGLEVVKDLELRERHMGDLQGVAYREAPIICAKAYQALASHQRDQEIPGGGESLDQLYQRCTSSLQRIAKKHRGERIVVLLSKRFIVELLHMSSLLQGFRIRQSMYFICLMKMSGQSKPGVMRVISTRWDFWSLVLAGTGILVNSLHARFNVAIADFQKQQHYDTI